VEEPLGARRVKKSKRGGELNTGEAMAVLRSAGGRKDCEEGEGRGTVGLKVENVTRRPRQR